MLISLLYTSFLSLSAEGRADYKSTVYITDVVAEYALKHSTTGSVTLWKVLVKLIEPYDNLKEYFLIFLPTTSSFKANVKKSPCYKRICENLNDYSTLVMLFICCCLFCFRFCIILNKVSVHEAIDSYFVWRNGDIAVECDGKVCQVEVSY